VAKIKSFLIPALVGLALRFLNNRLGHIYSTLTVRVIHLTVVKYTRVTYNIRDG
jgi:hypothetical protein